jgi:2-keto-4-pentenoate hydratase/2-oxohepta-3-ene-1,7-dioic acid hydratase in catechol pathway
MSALVRYARVQTLAGPRYCVIEGETLWILDGAPWWSGSRRTEEKLPLEGATLLACSDASKIVCVGQNYRLHAKEMGKPVPEEPLLFLKPPSALNGAGSPIRVPPESKEVHHEAEVGLVIGERLTRANAAEAAKAIFAITCFNDVTARDIQKREVQHTRGKGFDTFACCGPWMVTGLSPNDLRVQARVNGVTKQDGRTNDMVFPPAQLVSFISHAMTLVPGDIISTGTPSGVGPIRAGDTVEIEIEGVGVLRNPVIAL